MGGGLRSPTIIGQQGAPCFEIRGQYAFILNYPEAQPSLVPTPAPARRNRVERNGIAHHVLLIVFFCLGTEMQRLAINLAGGRLG